MKRIPESKVARWPQSITKLALIYACCFVLAAMISFSVCYAYFSSKIEATGNITVGKLEIQYVDGDSNTLSTLQTTITRDGSTILDENEEEDLIIPTDYTIVPGDIINIKGNIKNTGSIDAFVVIQAEFMLMSVDGTTVAKTFDSKFYDLSGNLITYDTTNKIYTTPATVLSVDETQDLTSASLSYTVSTGLTSEYSGRTFKLRLTTHAIQSEKLEKDEKYGFPTDESADDYETLTNQAFAVQATNMLLNRTPHLVTDAKIYGNSVQKVGNGKNLFSMYDFVEYQNNLADDESNSISTKSEIVSFDGKTCLYAQAINLYDSTTKTFYYWEFNGAPSTQYTISFKGYITQLVPENAQSTRNSGFRFYYSDGQASSAYLENMIGWQETTFTTTSGKTIIGIGLVYNYSYMTYYTDIQLEQGITATEYVPYAGKNLLPDVIYKYNKGTYLAYNTNSTDIKTMSIKVKDGKTIPSGVYLGFSKTDENSTSDIIWLIQNGQLILSEKYSTYQYVKIYATETQFEQLFDACEIQLEIGSTATEYEPYIYTPGPINPVEIESVGEKTKNLFNVGTMDDYYVNDNQYSLNYFTIEDNKLVGLNKKDAMGCLTKKEFYSYVTGDSYTFSFESNASQPRLYVVAYNASKENISSSLTISGLTYNTYYAGLYKIGNTLTFTTTDTNVRYFKVGFVAYDASLVIDTDYITFYNIQLEKGTTATEYEPYGYKLDITTRGKNLFNNKVDPVYRNVTSKTVVQPTSTGIKFTEQEIPSGSAFRAMVYPIDKVETIGDRTIYFSTDVIREGFTKTDGTKLRSTIILGYCDYDGSNRVQAKTLSYTDSGLYNMSVTIDSKTYAGKYACVWLYSVATNNTEDIPAGSTVEYTNLMISIGEEEYEPYIGNKTHTIYLDEPLRKVGDVADYIEIKDGVAKVVRKVKQIIFDGTETWEKSGSAENRFLSYVIDPYATIERTILCDRLIFNGNRAVGTIDMSFTSGGAMGTQLVFGLEFDTLQEMKLYLVDEYAKGTPMYIMYALYEPTETIIELDDMFTLAGNTIYEFNTEIAPSDYYFS